MFRVNLFIFRTSSRVSKFQGGPYSRCVHIFAFCIEIIKSINKCVWGVVFVSSDSWLQIMDGWEHGTSEQEKKKVFERNRRRRRSLWEGEVGAPGKKQKASWDQEILGRRRSRMLLAVREVGHVGKIGFLLPSCVKGTGVILGRSYSIFQEARAPKITSAVPLRSCSILQGAVSEALRSRRGSRSCSILHSPACGNKRPFQDVLDAFPGKRSAILFVFQ